MKKIFAILLITAIACNTEDESKEKGRKSMTQETKGKDTTIGIVGADSTKVISPNVYQYINNVRVSIHPDSANAGEHIIVNDFEIRNQDANNFAGVYQNYVLIDNGTGPNKREIVIYNITTKELTFSTKYEGELKIENGKLHYINASSKVENAKEQIDSFSNENKCSTKGCKTLAGYAAYFDFETLKSTTTKDIKCYCEQ